MSSNEPRSGLPPSPRVVTPLSPDLHRALYGILGCALPSMISTFFLLLWLTYRLIFWRRYYSRYLGYNQCILLIYNLLLADFIQASSTALFSPHWLRTNTITSYSPACFTQGLLINFGDLASGLFVLAIAAHTFTVVIQGKHIRHGIFIGCVVALWIFCALVSFIAPMAHGRYVYVPAGSWCWIDAQYEAERLYLHYLWIFVSEFGIVILYSALFVVLRRRIHVSKGLGGSTDFRAQKFSKVIQLMLLYPFAYIVFSLPIAAGRMSLMNGQDPGETYFYAAGCMIMCCGWVDSILYFVTRRRLLDADVTHTSGTHGSQHNKSGHRDLSSNIEGGADPTQDEFLVKARQPRQSTSSSTENIIKPDEFELGQVKQTTEIRITTESAGDTSASNSPGAYREISDTPGDRRGPAQPENTREGPMKYLKGWRS